MHKEVDLRFVFGHTPLEYRDTLHLIAEGKVDCAPMITGVVGLDGVANAFDALKDPEQHAKILVDPGRRGSFPVPVRRCVSRARSSSSARIGTPRLQDCTPCATQSFRTSMISATVAPAARAPLMWRRVPGAYRCVYEASNATLSNSTSFALMTPLAYTGMAVAKNWSVHAGSSA